jgi:hypothetical protein
VDGAGGFEGEAGIGVFEERGDFGCEEPALGEEDGDPDVAVGVAGEAREAGEKVGGVDRGDFLDEDAGGVGDDRVAACSTDEGVAEFDDGPGDRPGLLGSGQPGLGESGGVLVDLLAEGSLEAERSGLGLMKGVEVAAARENGRGRDAIVRMTEPGAEGGFGGGEEGFTEKPAGLDDDAGVGIVEPALGGGKFLEELFAAGVAADDLGQGADGVPPGEGLA